MKQVHRCWFPVREMERVDERGGGGMSGGERSQRRADWQIWKSSQEGGRDTNFSLPSSLYLPFKKREWGLIKHLSFQESSLMSLTLKGWKEGERDETRREKEGEGDVYFGVDGGNRRWSGRDRGGRGQEIRVKLVKGSKRKVKAGVKRGELHTVWRWEAAHTKNWLEEKKMTAMLQIELNWIHSECRISNNNRLELLR